MRVPAATLTWGPQQPLWYKGQNSHSEVAVSHSDMRVASATLKLLKDDSPIRLTKHKYHVAGTGRHRVNSTVCHRGQPSWTATQHTQTFFFYIFPLLALNIPSLDHQRCLPSWGPRRTPWFFCNFSNVWCGRLLKLCFWGFWNYNSVIQALLASNILCLFISTEVTGGTGLLHTHSSLIQHLNNVIFWALSAGHFFKFTKFRT